jgi:hypothetical protein
VTASVADTGDYFLTGVNDTSEQFIAGDNDTVNNYNKFIGGDKNKDAMEVGSCQG